MGRVFLQVGSHTNTHNTHTRMQRNTYIIQSHTHIQTHTYSNTHTHEHTHTHYINYV